MRLPSNRCPRLSLQTPTPAAPSRSIVGISATVAFAIVRIVVALDSHKPLGIDVWWHELMVSTESDLGLVLA